MDRMEQVYEKARPAIEVLIGVTIIQMIFLGLGALLVRMVL